MKNRLLLLVLALVLIMPLMARAEEKAQPAAADCGTSCDSCPSAASCGATDAKDAAPAAKVVEPAKDAAKVEPAQAAAPASKEGMITVKDLNDLIQKKEAVVILDARSGKFDDGKRIPGAQSLTEEATAEQVKALILKNDAKVITYCAGLTCPASGKLAAHLKKLGYTNVTEFPEGIKGWVDAGFKVETAVKK